MVRFAGLVLTAALVLLFLPGGGAVLMVVLVRVGHGTSGFSQGEGAGDSAKRQEAFPAEDAGTPAR